MSKSNLHRWDCTECGINKSSNDQWFENDVCGECITLFLTPKEKIFLDKFCFEHSRILKRQSRLNFISGGFCNIEFKSCDADEIVLFVKIGSVDEGGSYVDSYNINLDRETLTLL